MQAITTRFIPPTNTRGARISVRAAAGRMVVSWKHNMGVDENHDAAALAFLAKMDWTGGWVGGSLPDGRGNVYVRSPVHSYDTAQHVKAAV